MALPEVQSLFPGEMQFFFFLSHFMLFWMTETVYKYKSENALAGKSASIKASTDKCGAAAGGQDLGLWS